jgi:phenylacetate-coenzyme A ligase PaaK-like adenylate-forming protein
MRPGCARATSVINTLAYHFVPAGSMFESGAKAIGCTVVPAGTGQTEMQVATIRDLGHLELSSVRPRSSSSSSRRPTR